MLRWSSLAGRSTVPRDSSLSIINHILCIEIGRTPAETWNLERVADGEKVREKGRTTSYVAEKINREKNFLVLFNLRRGGLFLRRFAYSGISSFSVRFGLNGV